MKITTLGVVYALKNIGTWLASYTIAGIKGDPASFLLAFVVFALISIPSDLFMLNHISTKAKLEAKEKLEKEG